MLRESFSEENILTNPKNYIWTLGGRPILAEPYHDMPYLNDLAEKVRIVEWLWQTYWVFEQNSLVESYGNRIIKEMIDYEMFSGRKSNPMSITSYLSNQSKLTIDAFDELHKLNQEMIYNRKLSVFNLLTQAQHEILTSNNPKETLKTCLLKFIYPY
jgi:hypothetical protein